MILMKKFKENIQRDKEFNEIIQEVISNPTVNEMRKYRHHKDTSCFEHCMHVSYYSYLICKKYNLDYISAARAGMLHDLFLYDWHINDPNRKGLHGYTHPKLALDNSLKLFDLNLKEKDMIVKHMWPVTIKLPKYKESYIITFVDKYCAIMEGLDGYEKIYNLKKFYRYAYLFFSLLIFV